MTFEEWLAENEDDLWAAWHESGAYTELDSCYEDFIEARYEAQLDRECNDGSTT